MRPTALVMLLAALGGCASPAPLTGQAADFANFRDGQDGPAYRAPLVASAPVVDGRMDAAYESAEPIELVFINGAPGRPQAQTTARVVCTPDALYAFYRCRAPGTGGLTWAGRHHDAAIWQDNSVEIFLEPTGTGSRRYYQVIVNPGGKVADLLGRDLKAWNPALEVATRPGRREWTTEIRIPFAELGLTGGRINKVWRMNLTRFSLRPAEDTSWCVLGDYSSHTPERFGWLWVDAGSVRNVSDQDMQPWVPIFNGRNLAGWRLRRGKAAVRDGAIVVERGAEAVLVRDEPLPHDDLVLSADVVSDKQLRFCFSPDAANRKMGFYATFINLINESNVALMRDWDYWAPPLGGHLTIPHYGPCPMADGRWVRLQVRFRPDRVSLLLNGRTLLEAANLYPRARHFALHIIGAARVRNVRLRRLLSAAQAGKAR